MRPYQDNPNRPRKPRRRVAGFSIIEALVAAGVLGIGLIALVKLHQSAMRGMKSSRSVGMAMDIAIQAAEELTAQPAGSLPNCPAPATRGCKAGLAPLAPNYSAVTGCTNWVSEGPIPTGGGSTAPALTTVNTEANAIASDRSFRIDRVISNHPDGNEHANARIVEVFVCWRDDDGYIRQVSTSRMVQ